MTVGVDTGERREQGRLKSKEESRRVKERVLSTHGIDKSVNMRYPLESGVERGYMQVTREGERRKTKGVIEEGEKEEIREKVGEKGAGKKEASTRREGGLSRGWGTRRVANRYDYYREGHRVNRMSEARCKSSLEANMEKSKRR